MEIRTTFPGGQAVTAHLRGHTVLTDQPAATTDGSGPSPLELLFVALATCAGFYALRFCQQRGLAVADLAVELRTVADPAEPARVHTVEISVTPPSELPERYRDAIRRAVSACAVKRYLERPPQIEVRLEPSLAATPAG